MSNPERRSLPYPDLPRMHDIITHRARDVRFQMHSLLTGERPRSVAEAQLEIAVRFDENLEDRIAFLYYNRYIFPQDSERDVDYASVEARTLANESFLPTDEEIAVVLTELSYLQNFRNRPDKKTIEQIVGDLEIDADDVKPLKSLGFRKTRDLLKRKSEKIQFIHDNVTPEYGVLKRFLSYLLDLRQKSVTDPRLFGLLAVITEKFAEGQYVYGYQSPKVSSFVNSWLSVLGVIEGLTFKQIQAVFGKGFITRKDIKEYFGEKEIPEILFPRTIIMIRSKKERGAGERI